MVTLAREKKTSKDPLRISGSELFEHLHEIVERQKALQAEVERLTVLVQNTQASVQNVEQYVVPDEGEWYLYYCCER